MRKKWKHLHFRDESRNVWGPVAAPPRPTFNGDTCQPPPLIPQGGKGGSMPKKQFLKSVSVFFAAHGCIAGDAFSPFHNLLTPPSPLDNQGELDGVSGKVGPSAAPPLGDLGQSRKMRCFRRKIVMGLCAAAFAALMLGHLPLAAQAPSAEWILGQVDGNRTSGNKIILSEMVIHGRRGSRSVRAKSWIQGVERSFSEYLDPPREKGTKMLKLADQLWIYTPATDRTILISGHLLRQSVMGSDLSYEDMMEDPVLSNNYQAKLAGEETVLDQPCWKLELDARKTDVSYPRRMLWVDKERFVVLKEERYAKSGTLLKTTEVKSVRRIEGRWVPDQAVFKDALKSGEGTEFIVESIEFDASIPDTIFSKASLRK
jgi:outer membrane lipoprotein-sorting protein